MKFEIRYLDKVDENYPISPWYSIEATAVSKEEAIEKFKTYRPLCVMMDINEME